jgi:hypothetical protein
MKSPGVIYRRYRQFKRKLLYEKMVKARKVEFCNCHYGETLDMFGQDGNWSYFQICTYDRTSDGIDGKKPFVCQSPTECDAYVSKWTKEKVVEKFEEELSDWDTKQELYPGLAVLEWVLDKDLSEAVKNPNMITRVLVRAMIFIEFLLRYMNNNQKN